MLINDEDFGGDVYMYDDIDGGDISIVNGLVVGDRAFATASYLSLFGGCQEDDGKVDDPKTWWGNRFRGTPEDEKLVSRVQAFFKRKPVTTKNIQIAEELAKQDLEWLITDGVADDVSVEIHSVDKNRIQLTVIVKKSGELIEKGNWTINWEVATNGIRK